MKKKILALVLAAITVFSFCGCEATYEYPEGAPYEGIPELSNYNYSTSFSDFGKHTKFSAKLKWKPEENYTATYTSDYYLEWQDDMGGELEYIKPTTDKPKTNGKEYTLKPGEKVKIDFDIDSYYDNLPGYGTYHFVKVIKVDENGTEKKYLVHFDLTFEDDEDTDF